MSAFISEGGHHFVVWSLAAVCVLLTKSASSTVTPDKAGTQQTGVRCRGDLDPSKRI